MNRLLQVWLGNNLPRQHFPKLLKKNSIKDMTNILFKSIILHPIKRRFSKYFLLVLRKLTNLTVIGITGSAGKTTTKDMLVSVLSQNGKVVASHKNIDPVFNIPSTILKCRHDTKYLILEMGVEYPGEMDFYMWLAKPDVGVITNIYPTHTQFFGDEKGVFREKSTLIKSLGKTDYCVLNFQNKLLKILGKNTKSHIVFFGENSEVSATKKKLFKNGETSFVLTFDQDSKTSVTINIPIMGFQFVENALAAASVAKILGFSLKKIKNGLEHFKADEHRMKIIKHHTGALIIDDTYNNNPVAAKEAINAFLTFSQDKKKVVIFGDMLELGNLDKKYHEELGRFLGEKDISKLICVGKSVKFTVKQFIATSGKSNAVIFDKSEEAFDTIEKLLKMDVVVLVKGSRSIGLDKLVKLLCTS